MVVATAKNIESLIDKDKKDKMNYFEPGYPFIIVKKLTKEIITEASDRRRRHPSLINYKPNIQSTSKN